MDDTDEIKDYLMPQTEEWFAGIIDSKEIFAMESDDKKYNVNHDVLKLEGQTKKQIKIYLAQCDGRSQSIVVV